MPSGWRRNRTLARSFSPYMRHPGLDPGSRFFSSQHVVEILPFGISTLDQRELPCARPALDALLLCDGIDHRWHVFGSHQVVQPVPLAEIRSCAGAVLRYAGRKVGGHANIDCPAISIGHDVDPAAALPHSTKGKGSGTPGQARGDGGGLSWPRPKKSTAASRRRGGTPPFPAQPKRDGPSGAARPRWRRSSSPP